MEERKNKKPFKSYDLKGFDLNDLLRCEPGGIIYLSCKYQYFNKLQ